MYQMAAQMYNTQMQIFNTAVELPMFRRPAMGKWYDCSFSGGVRMSIRLPARACHKPSE